jgi:hypothetical protein
MTGRYFLACSLSLRTGTIERELFRLFAEICAARIPVVSTITRASRITGSLKEGVSHKISQSVSQSSLMTDFNY